MGVENVFFVNVNNLRCQHLDDLIGYFDFFLDDMNLRFWNKLKREWSNANFDIDEIMRVQDDLELFLEKCLF